MKMKVELLAVTTARADFEYKIMQREEEIEKLKEQLAIQDNKIEELKKRIEE